MATDALPSCHILGHDDAAMAHAPSRPSLMRRFYIAMLVSQMRRAQREIDRTLGPGALQRIRAELPPRR